MELDNPSKPKFYRKFEGTFPNAIVELKKDGRQPLASHEILARRVEMFQEFNETPEASNWWNNYWDTATASSIDKEGNLKIIHNAQQLYDLTPQSKLRRGALPLTVQEYDDLKGFSFTKKELDGMVLSQDLTDFEQIKSHLIWQALTNGDSTLLSDYATAYMQLRSDKGWARQGMGIYLPSSQDVPTMRAWFLGRLGGWSDALGGGNLDRGDRRLAGKLAPKVLDA